MHTFYPTNRERELRTLKSTSKPVKMTLWYETSDSPAKFMSVWHSAPLAVEISNERVGDEDRDLTMVEKDCGLTSGEEEVDDLKDFVTEKFQFLSKRGLEQLVGEENLNVEEILCGSVDVAGDVRNRVESVCPEMTRGSDVESSDGRVSPGDDINRILREKLDGWKVNSTPV